MSDLLEKLYQAQLDRIIREETQDRMQDMKRRIIKMALSYYPPLRHPGKEVFSILTSENENDKWEAVLIQYKMPPANPPASPPGESTPENAQFKLRASNVDWEDIEVENSEEEALQTLLATVQEKAMDNVDNVRRKDKSAEETTEMDVETEAC